MTHPARCCRPGRPCRSPAPPCYAVAGWRRATAWVGAGAPRWCCSPAVLLGRHGRSTGGAGHRLGRAAARRRPHRVHAARDRRGRAARLRRHPGLPGRRIAAGRASARTAARYAVLVQLFLAAMALAVLAANLGRAVGGRGGHHDRHRVPGRAPPHPRRGRGRLEVRGDLLGRHRPRLPRHRAALLRRPARRPAPAPALDWATLTAPRPQLDPAVTRIAVGLLVRRLRHQGRPRPAARLAARRPQPGPRPGVGADVRGPAVGRVLRHPAGQGHRRRRPRARVRPRPAAGRRAGLARGRRVAAAGPARLQADAGLLQHRAHGPARPRRRRRRRRSRSPRCCCTCSGTAWPRAVRSSAPGTSCRPPAASRIDRRPRPGRPPAAARRLPSGSACSRCSGCPRSACSPASWASPAPGSAAGLGCVGGPPPPPWSWWSSSPPRWSATPAAMLLGDPAARPRAPPPRRSPCPRTGAAALVLGSGAAAALGHHHRPAVRAARRRRRHA